jgi:hypothetical protein
MEPPNKIDIRVDEPYILKLPGLGTTGVIRTYEVIQTRRVVDAVEVSTTEVAGEGEQFIAGGITEAEFMIRGRNPGTSMIQFFKQYAGKNSERQKEHLLEVNVRN